METRYYKITRMKTIFDTLSKWLLGNTQVYSFIEWHLIIGIFVEVQNGRECLI